MDLVKDVDVEQESSQEPPPVSHINYEKVTCPSMHCMKLLAAVTAIVDFIGRENSFVIYNLLLQIERRSVDETTRKRRLIHPPNVSQDGIHLFLAIAKT